MTTAAMSPNHLEWKGCANVRDVGGMPTSDDKVIRTGALIRSDALHKLHPEGIVTFRALKVGRIIDLRRVSETERSPSPFAGDEVYRNIPVQDPADPDHEWLTLAQIYLKLLDLRADLFAEVLKSIVDAPEGAVVVHCAAGKDRTGLVVALALTIAGVSRDHIADDYALTEIRLAEIDRIYREAITDPELREVVTRLQPTPRENMLIVLDHLESAYGGVEAYLRKGGLGDEHFALLRTRLVA